MGAANLVWVFVVAILIGVLMFSWIVRTPKTEKIKSRAVEGETLRANYEYLSVASHKATNKPRNFLSTSRHYLDTENGTRFSAVPLLSSRSRDAVVFLMSAYPGRFSHSEPRPALCKGDEQLHSANLSLDKQEFKTSQLFIFALDVLPLAALVTNADGQIIFANALAESLLGYSHGELIGLSSCTILPAPQVETASPTNVSGTLKPLVAEEPKPATLDLLVLRKGGEHFPAEVTITTVSRMDKPYVLTIICDRTDRHELIRNRHQLAHLTRVSALGELAGSLAHELNQPLTAILSNAQAAQRFMATEPINLVEVREILQDLVQDNRRASEVIRKIRALVKKGELESAPLSIATVLSDVALLVRSDAIVRGIRVTVSDGASLPAIHGDKIQLEQVVLNLLLNAFDATESSAKSSRRVTLDASLMPSGDICVAVQDFGTGIASGTIDKLFTPFFTSKRDGLGLGLSISRSIVEMHGGSIWAENNKDRGATFYFTLPTQYKASGYTEDL